MHTRPENEEEEKKNAANYRGIYIKARGVQVHTHAGVAHAKRVWTYSLSCIYRKGNMLIVLEWLIIAP